MLFGTISKLIIEIPNARCKISYLADVLPLSNLFIQVNLLTNLIPNGSLFFSPSCYSYPNAFHGEVNIII